MNYRLLKRDEIERLRDIDRSEIIENLYYLKDGKLALVKEFYDIKGWHPAEVKEYISRLFELYDRSGTIYGAFDGSHIAGMIALESKFIGKEKETLKLDILYISKEYRKMGIGRELVKLVKNRAKEMGASKLYVSATPTQNTVDFYMGLGCELASEINKELFELEPEDIHLEMKL